MRGLGFAYHIKATGGTPHENVEIRFEADGTVALITGTQTIGQGHETTFPQILADRLGLPNEPIRLVQGDTDLIAKGGGHGSSRATYMGGTAIWRAADEIIAKGTRLAAEMLEAAEADIRFADGEFVVAGTDRRLALLDVAAAARVRNTPLDTYHCWEREWMTFPNGAHVVEVEIERDTGQVRLARYTAVDDYGVLVNPMIATGQAHGAIAQGAGQALFEHASLRRRHRPARRRLVARLRLAASRRPRRLRSRLQPDAVHDQPARRQRLRRSGGGRRLPGHRQRDPRRARTLWRERARRSGFARADLAYDRRLRTGYGRQEAAMNLFERYRVADAAAAAERIPVIDYGPYFAGEKGALERVAAEVEHACEEIGFFYALNHGVPEALIERAFAASRRFHALPLETKLALRLNQNNIGYLPINASVQGASTVHKATKPNQNESFFISHDRGSRPSRRDRREAVARAQPVAAGRARHARRHDGIFCGAGRPVRPDAAAFCRGARHAGRFFRPLFCRRGPRQSALFALPAAGERPRTTSSARGRTPTTAL